MQMRVLAWRACLNVARHPTLLRVQMLTFVGMALFIGLSFEKLGNACDDDDEQDADDRAASDFQKMAGLFSYMLNFFAFAGLSMLSAVAEVRVRVRIRVRVRVQFRDRARARVRPSTDPDPSPRPNLDQDWRLFCREYHAGLYRAEVHVTTKLALDLLLARVPPSP